MRVESLAYGPHGIARDGGKVHFVRHTAPGDEVEIEIREEHGAYAFADMMALVRAGETRRTPPCDYLPDCGGCSWQHVDYGAQLEAKERAVVDLLRRVGGIDAPILPILASPAEFGYRRRLSLRVEDGNLGYFAAASHQLVRVDHCLLATPALSDALPLAQRLVEQVKTKVKRLEIAIADETERVVIAAQAEGRFDGSDTKPIAEFLSRNPRLKGVILRGRAWRRVWGNVNLDVELATGAGVEVRAGSFSQVNAAANALMVETVLNFAACTADQRVLDLYAGFGNLTFPLAERARQITAVERDVDGVRAGEAYARRAGYHGVHFVAGDVPEVLARWVREERPIDLVVLDPPRSGAANAMESLLRLAPARIVYISCNPSTLARDLKLLSSRYRVRRVQPIDFFPQTYHVETVADLVLTEV